MRLALLVLGTMVLVEAAEESSNFFTDHPYARGTLFGLALLAVAAGWLLDARARAIGRLTAWPPSVERAASMVLSLLPAASIAFAVQNRGPGVFIVPAWIGFAIVAGGLGACLALLPRMPIAVPVFAALIAGIGLRAFDFIAVPIDARRADMVPLVGAAVARLLQGHDPYVLYGMPWPLPLTYMPLTWLAYVPAVLAGLDLRWTSAACELGLLALLWRKSTGDSRRAFLLLYAAWFASTVMPYTDSITAMPVQSCALAAAMVLVGTRSRWAATSLGAAAATTPLVGALAPMIALAWYREGRWRLVARRGAVAALVFAVLVVPWIIGNPRGFWVGPVRWFNNIDGFPRRTWNQSHAWAWVPGLTGTFWTLGAERALRPVQALLVGGIVALLARVSRGRSAIDRVALVQAALATMVAFVAFNVIVWPYHYEPAMTLALSALALSGRRAHPSPANDQEAVEHRPETLAQQT